MCSHVVKIDTSFNNIPKLATTLWYSGCNLNCCGCHNTILKDFKDGFNLTEVKQKLIERRQMTDWLLYLGGNPLDNIDSVIEISTYAKELRFNQFMYSGYSFNEFMSMFDYDTHNLLLNNFDYIKTGKFEQDYSKNSCSDIGKEYFFSTLNQEVYHSNKTSWEKFYSYDFMSNTILGNFITI
jgi:organic radical activating enzyme